MHEGPRTNNSQGVRTRVLWVNPSFLDYRVPVYRELDRLVGGNLWVVYSRDRTPERVSCKISRELGSRAIGLTGERYLRLGRQATDMANVGVVLPWQRGLLTSVLSVKADVIVAEGFFQWTPAAMMKAAMHHTPLVISYERTAHTERNCPAWRSAFRQGIIRLAGAAICNGSLCADYVRSLGMPVERIVTGGMAADSDWLKQAAADVSADARTAIRAMLKCHTPTFLYVGKINHRKGVSHLLRAWEMYTSNGGPGALLVVGDGPDLATLEHFTQESCIPRVNFLGNVNYERIPEIYVAADVFIIATLEDNWSLVVPEAMACGLPIACSRYNGCWPELVQEGCNGTVFDPLKQEDGVRALWFFAQRIDSLHEMGQRSVKIEEAFSPANAARAALRGCRIALEGPTSAEDNGE
jgi:glycosyltransferase involved in cell wall biosynthesis